MVSWNVEDSHTILDVGEMPRPIPVLLTAYTRSTGVEAVPSQMTRVSKARIDGDRMTVDHKYFCCPGHCQCIQEYHEG